MIGAHFFSASHENCFSGLVFNFDVKLESVCVEGELS